jgi:hypothetical protein
MVSSTISVSSPSLGNRLATGGSFQHPCRGVSGSGLADWLGYSPDRPVDVSPMPVLEFEGRRITPLEQVPNPRTAEGDQATEYLAHKTANSGRIWSYLASNGAVEGPPTLDSR